MGIQVRQAELDDIPWIMVQLKQFSAFYGTKFEMFPEHEEAAVIIREIIEKHVFIVAFDSVTNGRAGLIAGFGINHILNPKLKILSECFWWVDEQYRNSRAGFLLLAEFIKQGKLNYTWVTLSLIEDRSPINPESLIKRGFTRKETAFLLEV